MSIGGENTVTALCGNSLRFCGAANLLKAQAVVAPVINDIRNHFFYLLIY